MAFGDMSVRQMRKVVGASFCVVAGFVGTTIIGAKYNAKIEKQKALIEQSDSIKNALKIDSIAHTNYAKGMQAVRDSLAKVDSVKVTKTLIHK